MQERIKVYAAWVIAAFGKVVEGMDVVDEIASCETDYSDRPLIP